MKILLLLLLAINLQADIRQMTPVDLEKAAKAHAYPYYPEDKITPGAINVSATVKDVCTAGFTRDERHVTNAQKAKSFFDYRLTSNTEEDFKFGDYEVDHFFSLELGGSNDQTNLWPQPYFVYPGARQKDAIETHLKHEICRGHLTLDQARWIIKTDWVNYYFNYKKIQPKYYIIKK